MITLQPMNIVQAAADLVWSPVLRKFPDLQDRAVSEGGIGWIPYFLERVDYVYKHHHAWTHQDFGDKLPSEVFRERIVTCFIDDAFGIESRDASEPRHDHVGVRLPALRLDVAAARPRSLDEVPRRRARRRDRQDHAPERDAHLLLRPVHPHPREQCTVGALRAQATDVDMAFRSSPRLKKTGDQIVTLTSSGRV